MVDFRKNPATSSTSGAAESTVEDLLPVASEEVQPAKVNDNSLI